MIILVNYKLFNAYRYLYNLKINNFNFVTVCITYAVTHLWKKI